MPAAIEAPPVGLLSSTLNVSGDSKTASSIIGMKTVCVVSPGAKVTVIFVVAVKSSACALSEFDKAKVASITV